MSAGARDLAHLRANAAPLLHPAPVAVATLAGGEVPDALRAQVIATMREREGLTLYVDLAAAEAAGLPILMRAAWISLDVHSDLEAVGFTAVFAQALAARGIAANVVAGAWHDHVFVPLDRAQDAMDALRSL